LLERVFATRRSGDAVTRRRETRRRETRSTA
jgi:hypothetical protein